jgi:hypothetical protein
MKFKLSFLTMVYLLVISLLIPVPVFSITNTKFPDRTERLRKEKTPSQPFENPFVSGPSRAWGDGGDGDGNDLEDGAGAEGIYNDPSAPISDGTCIFILFALFYGVIIQRNNKLKHK